MQQALAGAFLSVLYWQGLYILEYNQVLLERFAPLKAPQRPEVIRLCIKDS